MSSATFQPTASLTVVPTCTQAPTATVSSSPSPTLSPTVTATPTPQTCWKKGGKFEPGSLETELLRYPLDYRVYLPPCYIEQPERSYPVLYLMHGQSFTDDQWDRLGADETANALIAAGKIAPLIIVLPRDRYGDQPDENKFGQVVIEVLIPYVDQNYRTLTDRSHRAVGGLSRGAGWAIHLAISNWEYFSALGAHSPAVFHNDAQQMRTWLGLIPPEEYPRIYIDVGDHDRPEILDSAQWFERLLNEKDIPHDWYLFSGYHEEDYWSAHLEKYLLWYSRDW
ncbi:MAG: hypothetical protein JXB15_11980 [Anaerolineales bacterium]|nr:hypothetical protein [Anaerolineales bacterium]